MIISPNMGLNIPEGNDVFDYKKYLKENLEKIDENFMNIPLSEELTATEGQTVFNLANSYTVGANTISVEVDGVPQELGEGFTESSSTSITLSEGVPAGAVVSVNVFKTPAGINTKIAELTTQLADIAINVKNFGAKGDGVTDDTVAIQNAINYVKHAQYDKGSAKIIFPVPSKFYKITSTLDLSEIWNVTLECPSKYGWQRQAVNDIDTEYKLIHWYGASGGNMFKLDYSFGLEFKNITLNGRNLAGDGFSIKPSISQASVTRDITFYDCISKYCDIGMNIGDLAAQTDNGAISLYNCNLFNNKSNGLKVASGNAYVYLFGTNCYSNGKAKTGTNKGANIHLISGELFINSYTSDGSPSDADIYMESGGLNVNGAWSDLPQGKFLHCTDSTAPVKLTRVRHFDSAMTTVNTPISVYFGGSSLTLDSCLLFNSVEVPSGKMSKIVSINTKFTTVGATFIGDMIATQRGLIEINTEGQNEARMSIGKPSRSDGGSFKPFTQWGASNRPLGVKTTDNYTVTEGIQEGSRFYEMLGNAYNDNGVYKAIAAGTVWRIVYFKNNVKFYTATDATTANETITWSDWAGFKDAQGSPNGNPALFLKTRKINWEAAAPTTGTHTAGDIIYNQAPAAGGKVGWVCVTGGAPGTWKPFGAIDA